MTLIVATGPDSDFVQEIITSMWKEFSLRKLGELNYFLGIQVRKCEKGLHLNKQ